MTLPAAKLVPELCITSLINSLNFYTKYLGFSVKYDRPEEGFAYLTKDGIELMLEQIDPNNRQWITGELTKPFGRGINFQIEISDVDSVHKMLQSNKYPIYMDIEDKWYETGDTLGGNRQFIVQDPDGYLLRLFTDLGSKPKA